jgi:hypothetical protein
MPDRRPADALKCASIPLVDALARCRRRREGTSPGEKWPV